MPFEVYQIRDQFDSGKWIIRQIENGKVVGVSKRTFDSKEEAQLGIKRIEQALAEPMNQE